LEAAKDVDSFTRLVVDRYSQLHRHLPLNDDDDEEDVGHGQSSVQQQQQQQQQMTSHHEPTSAGLDQRQDADDMPGIYSP